MHFETIRYDLTEALAVITLDRPEVMNALNTQMRTEITQALTQAAGEARAVVLTGTGRAFCSGQDLGDGAALTGPDLERILREEYEPMLAAVTECPVPVMAAVNGAAAGAGANLALCADLVIATHSAAFMQAFTRIGLMPDAGGTWALPRQVGLARAMGLALFAEKISAEEAARMGMIWEAVPDVDFEHHWRARAMHLAQGPTEAFKAVKQALRASFDHDLPAQLALEAKLQGALGETEDFREGVQAFLDKRAPAFRGK
ncbi:2-(1,2-epoxy-1,2-dihydrophenyl)acetyl-CoA isomerase [Rhodobacter aestuarii]|uniref:2-(1,2-epoxy-1,2-dihydrophenyl)acetyl-CoA isomerase n=1 Tax=Rhodobacter aestuarii TaxID=453582 RepID=A0A1N7K6M8_9RHOB|nr:enoyl-CoA hydratase-related protein [Rhodobacter aestuarii]PTV95835.1 2-(1,2-epoxy-1,2-dihydrophenyl)acetyl-CoA isomerase [Rhodobacter aestuarii]SIS57243.1 2-(1,2-epoxy-1,2-dihydrophenyl)acetyl-CoA isomerase [Rhodobacter aestuarii]